MINFRYETVKLDSFKIKTTPKNKLNKNFEWIYFHKQDKTTA